MAYTNPTKVNNLLKQIKNLIVEGDSTTDVDNLITSSQTEVDSNLSLQIQSDFKKKCNRKMRECDWTQIADSGLSAPDKTLWDTYRTDLKALVVPTDNDELVAIVWPTEPV